MDWIAWLIIGASLLVAIITLLIVIGCVLAKIITTPPKRCSDELVANQQKRYAADFDSFKTHTGEDFLLFSQGVEIRGTIVHNEVPTNKWVIIVHGFTASRLFSVKYAQIFLKLGFNCLIYDQRYFGESGGECCSMGYFERFDLVNVINYVKEKFGEDTFLALHGESMGAVTALCALEFTDKIDCVISDCAFADAKKYFAQRTKQSTKLPTAFPVLDFSRLHILSKYKFDLYKVSPLAVVQKTDVPILFFHGTADTETPRSNSIELYDKCKNTLSRICLVPDAEHACSVNDTKYYDTVANFVFDVYQSLPTRRE